MLLEKVEETPGYLPGKTPVVIIGDFNQSYMAGDRTEFQQYADLPGMYASSITYLGAFSNYCSKVLGHPMNLVEAQAVEKQLNLIEIGQMPAFPKDGFCKLIDGIMIVKL